MEFFGFYWFTVFFTAMKQIIKLKNSLYTYQLCNSINHNKIANSKKYSCQFFRNEIILGIYTRIMFMRHRIELVKTIFFHINVHPGCAAAHSVRDVQIEMYSLLKLYIL